DSEEDGDETNLERSQLESCGSLLHLVQAMSRTTMAHPPRLWLVTKGAQKVTSINQSESNPKLSIMQTPLLGLGRSLAQEHPELKCVRVDLDSGAQAADNIYHLFDEVWNAEIEDEVAYRQATRHVARLSRVRKASLKSLHSSRKSIHSDGTYLITGGLGGLG